MQVDILTGTVRGADGRARDLSPRRFALVAALARRRAGFSRSSLIEELWPELGEAAAVNAFNVCLFHLRRLLGEKRIAQERGSYRLGMGVYVDLWEIEQIVCDMRLRERLLVEEQRQTNLLVERLAAPRPPFYASWPWFEATERRIEHLFTELAQRCAREALREGRALEALTTARLLIERDACDEPAQEIAIRAHLALGDEAQAFQNYRRYKETVLREIGVSPLRSFSEMANAAADEILCAR